MKKLLIPIIILFMSVSAYAADGTINDQTALSARPAVDDTFLIWDVSTGSTKKITYDYLNDLNNVDSYGGLTAAVATISTTVTTILCNSAQPITDNLSVPTTLTLVCAQECSLNPTSTHTLTMNSTPLAGDYSITGGSGTVTFAGSGLIWAAWTGGTAGTPKISSLTASKPVFSNSSKQLVSAGTIPVDQGGTGQTTYTDGQLLIGKTAGNTLSKATLSGTTNEIDVTSGGGTITLSLASGVKHTWTDKTSGYQLLTADCVGQKTFGNNAAGSEVILTAPTGAANYAIHFYVVDAQYVQFKASNSEKIRYRGTQTAANGYVRSNDVGTSWTVKWTGDDWAITDLIGVLSWDQ